MNDQIKTTQNGPAMAATQPAAAANGQKPTHRAVTDPREVASLVMQRMNVVSTKKDELAIAIHGLIDITQQLTRTYGEQLLAIDQLRRRINALEAAAAPGADAAAPGATVQ
jgi:hypothetical protein